MLEVLGFNKNNISYRTGVQRITHCFYHKPTYIRGFEKAEVLDSSHYVDVHYEHKGKERYFNPDAVFFIKGLGDD